MDSGYKKRLFDFDKISVQLLTPFPLDITEGLVLKDSFLSISPVANNQVNYKVGLGGEVLVSENFNQVHILQIEFIPTAPHIVEIDLLKKAKTQFGILIQNNSAPKYKGTASECRILEKPKIDIGTSGFGDFTYKILMTDYVDVFIP
ncbi:MAG TPA: hypothetical protein PK079_25100 [Leptospiraceae bacterium]|nr:hypothetical protein [Leptospiraceae bacterium]HMW08590.1 hypothetical protein [Leptospiraceae bacterium]HMZ66549.1 hypothetical protein [Leptospiraceae bacterium]HNA10231.1 hypothetical protein [Leptospiraceae bacterium]HNB98553.1 hypothetical protein [Leptospiraceae bacterium]